MTQHQPTPTLDYQSPGQARWIVRTEADQVTLMLDGPPAWWQLARAVGGLLLCVGCAVAFLLIAWANAGRGRWLVDDEWLPLAIAGVAGLFAAGLAGELWRFHRFGPARPTYHLTSRHLSANPDPRVLLDGPDVLHVDDLFPWPGRLLFTGRRELLLRFALAQGPVYDVVWSGSLDDLQRLADELRDALRLNAPSAERGTERQPATAADDPNPL